MKDTPETNGLSSRELILEVRADLKKLMEDRREHDQKEAEEFGKRPTRAELYAALTAVLAIVGATMAITG